jgi:hypothetical protein
MRSHPRPAAERQSKVQARAFVAASTSEREAGSGVVAGEGAEPSSHWPVGHIDSKAVSYSHAIIWLLMQARDPAVPCTHNTLGLSCQCVDFDLSFLYIRA